jgi:hypothetical protein
MPASLADAAPDTDYVDIKPPYPFGVVPADGTRDGGQQAEGLALTDEGCDRSVTEYRPRGHTVLRVRVQHHPMNACFARNERELGGGQRADSSSIRVRDSDEPRRWVGINHSLTNSYEHVQGLFRAGGAEQANLDVVSPTTCRTGGGQCHRPGEMGGVSKGRTHTHRTRHARTDGA